VVVNVYRLTRAVAPVLAGLLRHEGADGSSDLPAKPVVVAANHASYLDPWCIAYPLPRLDPFRFLINEQWYRRDTLWTWFFRRNHVIPTVEGDPVRTILNVTDALDQGAAVGFFPEGRIARDGRVREGRPGLGWIAALSGAPVVPCGLRGTFETLPQGAWRPRRRGIRLRVGDPLRFPQSPCVAPSPEAVRRFVGDVMERICRLAGQPERIPHARLRREPADLRAALRDALGARCRPDGAREARPGAG
jgi:1-acyl-sn-glycerol-3-phosphate acyltransferase